MIFLLDSTKLIAQLLEPKLHAHLPTVGLEIFSSIGTLQQRLSGLHEDAVIAILAARHRSQLPLFEKLHEVFVDIRMVLLLPDHAPETIRLAHQLYPRYVSFKDTNLDDLLAVVARMHEKMHSCSAEFDFRL